MLPRMLEKHTSKWGGIILSTTNGSFHLPFWYCSPSLLSNHHELASFPITPFHHAESHPLMASELNGQRGGGGLNPLQLWAKLNLSSFRCECWVLCLSNQKARWYIFTEEQTPPLSISGFLSPSCANVCYAAICHAVMQPEASSGCCSHAPPPANRLAFQSLFFIKYPFCGTSLYQQKTN